MYVRVCACDLGQHIVSIDIAYVCARVRVLVLRMGGIVWYYNDLEEEVGFVRDLFLLLGVPVTVG